MKPKPFPAGMLAPVLILTLLLPSRAGADILRSAEDDIARQRYGRARLKLQQIAETTTGEEKQEALLLLAKLERDPDKAEALYFEIAVIDPESSAAKSAALEVAKMRYAAGDYRAALDLLRDAGACEDSDEACYFQGLAAMMLKDYRSARELFSRITRGRYRVWSALSLAEMEMLENDTEAACSRYHTLARANINPVAMYRFGECLERQGNKPGAISTFEEIIDRFQSTPEAVLATEKLKILRLESSPQSPKPAPEEPAPTHEEGFTIQFGSFRDRHNAIKLAERIKQTLPGVRIDTDLIRYREVHRVRFGFFPTREAAQRKADELTADFGNELTIMKIP